MEIGEMESWSDAALESCIDSRRAGSTGQDRFVAALELWHRGRKHIAELEALREKQSDQISKLGKENLELRQALRYLADEGNYDKHEEDEDYYRLVRPGGARKEGIFSLSRHLCAWVYAEAVGDEWQALQDHERVERLVLAENKDDRAN